MFSKNKKNKITLNVDTFKKNFFFWKFCFEFFNIVRNVIFREFLFNKLLIILLLDYHQIIGAQLLLHISWKIACPGSGYTFRTVSGSRGKFNADPCGSGSPTLVIVYPNLTKPRYMTRHPFGALRRLHGDLPQSYGGSPCLLCETYNCRKKVSFCHKLMVVPYHIVK
jgi:hypothetical protein